MNTFLTTRLSFRKQVGVSELQVKIHMTVTYRWERAQHFNSVLGGERMRRVQTAEIGQTSRRVGWSPTQYVTQLRRIGIDCVPRHQKLLEQRRSTFHVTFKRVTSQNVLWKSERLHLDGLGDVADCSRVQPHQSGHFSDDGVIFKPVNKRRESPSNKRSHFKNPRRGRVTEAATEGTKLDFRETLSN